MVDDSNNMIRDALGRYLCKGPNYIPPRRGDKGRFLPKEHKVIRAMRVHEEIENKKQKTEPDWPQDFNETSKCKWIGFDFSSTDIPIDYVPSIPATIPLPKSYRIEFPTVAPKELDDAGYTLEDIRLAFIAGLNDSQGILPLSKRFEMYCKRNGIT